MRGVALMTPFEFDHFQRVGRVLEHEKRRAMVSGRDRVAFVVRSGAGYYLGANGPAAVMVTSDPLVARRFETHGDALDCVRFMGAAGFAAEIVEVALVPYAAP